MKKLTYIYLIRHSEQLRINGSYESSESEQLKNEKIILTIEGEKKAQVLSEREELNNIDVLYSSNYTIFEPNCQDRVCGQRIDKSSIMWYNNIKYLPPGRMKHSNTSLGL